jgi:hypothetical protein
MLWYKAWRDTRWRFLIGLGILIGMVLASVLAYPSVHGLVVAGLAAGPDDALAREIDWEAQVSSSFRGYIWVQVVRQNFFYLWTVFAVLLGAKGPLSRRTGAIFTLSLPVSRRRLWAVRAATDLAELCVLALVPMLLIPLAAPTVGYTYALADSLVHGIQILTGGAVFYGLTLWLATHFEDRWRPILITLAAAVAANLCANFYPIPAILAPFNPATVMVGENYFRTGMPAWAGILLWPGVSAAMLYAAMRSIEVRDF